MRARYEGDLAKTEVLMLLIPILGHYDQFAESFVRLMQNKVEVSMMRGLLYLVIKVRRP